MIAISAAISKLKNSTFLKKILQSMASPTCTIKCKTCGELKTIEKKTYETRCHAIKNGAHLHEEMDIFCDFCKMKKFELFSLKKTKKITLSKIHMLINIIFEKIYNAIIFIFVNMMAEIWKAFQRFWKNDIQFYLNTIAIFIIVFIMMKCFSKYTNLNDITSIIISIIVYVVSVFKHKNGRN